MFVNYDHDIMKVFTKLAYITESRKDNTALTQEEFDKYAKAVNATKRSKEFKQLLWLAGQYPELLDKDILKEIIDSGKTIATLPVDTVKDIYTLAKKCGSETRLLPQFLTASQRDFVIAKRIDVNDLTLDLETPKGRNEIARRYMPLIEKLVHQYADKCPLSKEELRSAAMIGLTNAMNEYKNPEELEKAGKGGNMSFTNYAAYRIKQQILADITDFSRNVKISDYYQNKLKDSGEDTNREFSIDRMFGDSEDGPMAIDRFFGLADDDDFMKNREEDEAWKKLFKRIESKFSQRDCIVFYRICGVNGYKPEKTKDIAKELGVSSPAVTKIYNKIIKFMSEDKECQALKGMFEAVAEKYIVNKMCETYAMDKAGIIDSFLFDDTYMLIESLTRWNSKDKFQKAVNNATDFLNVDDALFIYNILQNKTDLTEKNLKAHRNAVVKFLNEIYPENTYKNAKNEELVETLRELQSVSMKFQIAW